MEVGMRIKEHRTQLGLSQDDLAQRIYVSRQTISSWENDKTYPDVQSLLILTQVFGTTVDDLIKGDVEAMTKTIDNDVRLMKRLSLVMLGFIVLMLAALVWMCVQLTVWGWSFAQVVPTIVLVFVLWGVAMFAALWAEKVKKRHDLVAYSELVAFCSGEPVERDTEQRRRSRLIPRWMRVVRTVGLTLLCMAIGAFCGYFGYAFFAGLLGV